MTTEQQKTAVDLLEECYNWISTVLFECGEDLDENKENGLESRIGVFLEEVNG